ncbi:cyclase family protein [Phenylobacterium sp.]|jgi:kynurenine formamidase|uniref:cyclase family protein n=1 Tax=Phenylobacterium sp. TaxID=1871053 RepID=UPI0037CC1579
MPRRLIDLSIPICNDVVTDPETMRPKVTYSVHAETVPQMAASFPGLTAADMPDGEGWAVERVSLSTHNGTHMDAPWHFHSTTDQATTTRAAPTIDEGPLEYFLQPGVKLDFRHFPDGYVATGADVEAELARIGHTLQPLDIVLVNTAAGAAYGAPDFIHKGCGMGEEATLYLTERGVKVVGTDAWSWDAPFSHTAKRWAETRDPKIIWEGHKAGRFREYYQIEKLTNLEALPANGFTLSCFPVKIAGASAGWIRAVAIVD